MPNNSALTQTCFMQILGINAAVRNACINGNLATAKELLTKEIDADADNYNSYANRSIIMMRQLDWDHALHDAIKVGYAEP
jgi:hypothetical protein